MTKILTAIALLCFLPGLVTGQTNTEEAIDRNSRGMKLFKEGKTEEAIAEFRKAAELDPSYGPARQNLGYAYDRQGRSQEALTEYKKAGEVDPKGHLAHNNMGVLYDKEGRYDEAIAAFEKALQVNPEDATAKKNLETARKNKAATEARGKAIAQAEKAAENSPEDPVGAYKLARLYAGMPGKKDQAIAWLEKALQLGYNDFVYLKVDPAFANLRDDSNFIRLLPVR